MSRQTDRNTTRAAGDRGLVRALFKPPSMMSRTAITAECGLMVALAFVLSLIPIFHMLWGGSVSCFATLPIIVASFRHGYKWGVGTAAVYGIVQALQGAGTIAVAGSIGAMLLCAVLDYLAAYAAVGLSGPIAKFLYQPGGARRDRGLMSPVAGMAVGILATGFIRLLCSFISGILIWYSYTPEGWSVWWYSLSYNAGWCVPDVAIVLVAAVALSRVRGFHLIG